MCESMLARLVGTAFQRAAVRSERLGDTDPYICSQSTSDFRRIIRLSGSPSHPDLYSMYFLALDCHIATFMLATIDLARAGNLLQRCGSLPVEHSLTWPSGSMVRRLAIEQRK